MIIKMFSFICLFTLISYGYSASVPPITKCKAADSDCIKTSSQALIPIFAQGFPELGVEKLDPAVFTKTIDASTSGLKLTIDDFVVTGLKDCVMQKLTRDVANSKLHGKVLCSVVGDGNYEMDGQLLIVRVQGKGKIHVVLRKILITIDADMAEKTKDGKKYWDVKRFTHTFKLTDKCDIKFENLFTGNDVLGRAASEVIENNGNDIIQEVGPPVILTIVKKAIENIKRFFNNVPADELALD